MRDSVCRPESAICLDQGRSQRRDSRRAGLLPIYARKRSRRFREGVRCLLPDRARNRRQYRHQRAAPGAPGGGSRPRRRGRSPSRSRSSRPSRRSTTPGHGRFSSTSTRVHSTWTSAALEAAITSRTKVILPVHLYGQPADMDPILDIAKEAGPGRNRRRRQAHGAEYKGRRAGSLGDMGCFSFYPGKNLGAYGEGGMVVTNNAEYARTIRMLRDWGAERKYEHVLKGYNFRLEGIQGAVLRVKLRHLEAWTEARRSPQHAATTGCWQAVALPRPKRCPMPGTCITSTRSARNIGKPGSRRCRSKGSIPGFTIRSPSICFRRTRIWATSVVNSPTLRRRLPRFCRLPMFPELTAAQCETVCNAVRKLAEAVGHRLIDRHGATSDLPA